MEHLRHGLLSKKHPLKGAFTFQLHHWSRPREEFDSKPPTTKKHLSELWTKNTKLFRLYRGWHFLPSSIGSIIKPWILRIPIKTTRIQWKVVSCFFLRGSSCDCFLVGWFRFNPLWKICASQIGIIKKSSPKSQHYQTKKGEIFTYKSSSSTSENLTKKTHGTRFFQRVCYRHCWRFIDGVDRVGTPWLSVSVCPKLWAPIRSIGLVCLQWPWKSETKQRMVLRMIHVKESLLPRDQALSLDFLGNVPWKFSQMCVYKIYIYICR